MKSQQSPLTSQTKEYVNNQQQPLTSTNQNQIDSISKQKFEQISENNHHIEKENNQDIRIQESLEDDELRKQLDKIQIKMKKDSTQKVILNLKCEELGINIDVEDDQINQLISKKSSLNTIKQSNIEINPQKSSINQIEYIKNRQESIKSQLVTQYDPQKKSCCNCKKKRCLKLYCSCFQNLKFCQNCCCEGCGNQPQNYKERNKIINSVNQKSVSSIQQNDQSYINHLQIQNQLKNCHCKKSNCLIKKCKCFLKGKKCSKLCDCVGCKNHGKSTAGKSTGSKSIDKYPIGIQSEKLDFSDQESNTDNLKRKGNRKNLESTKGQAKIIDIKQTGNNFKSKLNNAEPIIYKQKMIEQKNQIQKIIPENEQNVYIEDF